DAESEMAGREVLSAAGGAKGVDGARRVNGVNGVNGAGRANRASQAGGGGQDRILLLAARLRYRAAGAEAAPGRNAQRAWRVTRYGRSAVVRDALGHPGDRGEQAPGVGMARRAEDLLRGRDLDDPAQVHDRA